MRCQRAIEIAVLFKQRLHLRCLGVETGEDAIQIALQFVGGLRGFVNLCLGAFCAGRPAAFLPACRTTRSEEHTSELQSLMRISYAVFCLKKKKTHTTRITRIYMTI